MLQVKFETDPLWHIKKVISKEVSFLEFLKVDVKSKSYSLKKKKE